MGCVTRLGVCLLCGLALPVLASDLIADPPADRLRQVQAVPQQQLDGADPALRESIVLARADLNGLLARNGVSAVDLGEAYGRLGAFYHLAHLVTAAELAYRNAIALAPENYRWPYYAGHLLLANGRPDQALAHFGQAAALAPDDTALRFKQARAEYELNRYERAGAEFASLAEAPDFAAASRYYLGQIALLQRDYAAARVREQLALHGARAPCT